MYADEIQRVRTLFFLSLGSSLRQINAAAIEQHAEAAERIKVEQYKTMNSSTPSKEKNT